MSTPRKTAAIVQQAGAQIVQQPAAQFYDRFVAGIKQRIRTAQIKAALAANAELVLHYWEIGGDILASQQREGWGAKVVDRLAADLQREFPRLAGYSARNLKYMRAFAEAWPDRAIVQQLVALLPWGHHAVLLDRVKDPATREFYIRKTVEHGWSRSVLVHQLDTISRRKSRIVRSEGTLGGPASVPVAARTGWVNVLPQGRLQPVRNTYKFNRKTADSAVRLGSRQAVRPPVCGRTRPYLEGRPWYAWCMNFLEVPRVA